MKYTRQIGCLLTFIFGAALLAVHGQAAFSGASGNPRSPESYSGSAFGGSPSTATASAYDDDQSVLTIKRRVNEVNVLFIATDKHGKFVRNLNERDFNILDDHKPPESILAFRRETDLPIQMGLLVDVSGSVNSRF